MPRGRVAPFDAERVEKLLMGAAAFLRDLPNEKTRTRIDGKGPSEWRYDIQFYFEARRANSWRRPDPKKKIDEATQDTVE